LLDCGIDVYTTLNVQHLESLHEDVGRFAGIRVWETVSDTVFEEADEVELVDLPPDDILARLHEGKIYPPEKAERALLNFFRKGNLIALRELALRRTAEWVGAQLRDYRQEYAIGEVWNVDERILVCVAPGPSAWCARRNGWRPVSTPTGWPFTWRRPPCSVSPPGAGTRC
jgi:two-component system sensor histidine kinase KdpD